MQMSYSINTEFVCFIWVFCFVLFSFVLETVFHLVAHAGLELESCCLTSIVGLYHHTQLTLPLKTKRSTTEFVNSFIISMWA